MVDLLGTLASASIEFTLLSVAVVLVATIYSLFRYLSSKFDFFSNQGLQGPDATLPTGSWKGAWKTNIGEADLERYSKYGKIYGTFDGISPNMIVADAELIKKILHDDASHFRSRRAYRIKNEILRNSLLSIEGNDSKELKNVLSSAVSTDKIKKLVPWINQSLTSLVNSVKTQIKSDKDVLIDTTKEVQLFLSDVLAFTLFGAEFGAENNFKEEFFSIVESAFLIKFPSTGFAITPFIFDIVTSLDDFVLNKSSLQVLTVLCRTTMQAKRKQDVDTSEVKAVDFLDLLLAAAEEEKKMSAKEKGDAEADSVEFLLNDNQILIQLFSVVISIVQVAKSSLVLSLHTLAKLPAVQEKLRLEISKELEKHNALTYDVIQSCEYLDMFLGEILRMYPLEYRLERECIDQLTLGEAKLKSGIFVSVPVYAIHRHKDFYPEPDTFDPERFSADNAAKRDHYTYLPFGQAGANSTNIGIQLGVLVTKFAIAALVTDFNWTSVGDTKIPAEFCKGITGIPRPLDLFLKAEIK